MFRSLQKNIALCLFVGLAGFTTAGCYGILHPTQAQVPAKPVAINQTGTPEQFLQSIYANYGKNSTGINIFLPANQFVLDPVLAQLVQNALKAKEARGDEVGVDDADPICACQDHDDLTGAAISAKPQPDGRVFASVVLPNGKQTYTVAFNLAKIENKWRIMDMAGPAVPSFRKQLLADIATSPAPKK